MLSAQVAPAANTFYFSALGNDATGDGSMASPWQTIGKFNSIQFKPGESALFRAGDTFTGMMWLDANDSGADAAGNFIAPVKISSYGGSGATPRATVVSPINQEAFYAYNNGGVELSNFNFVSGGFTNENQRTNGVRILSDSVATATLKKYQHVRVDNVTASGFGLNGLQVWAHNSVGFNDVQITNSEFSGNGYAGIYVGASQYLNKYHSGVVVDGVSAHNNPGFSSSSLPYTGHGVIMANVDGGVIQNSVAYDNGLVNGNGNVGLWTYQANAVTIQNNVAYGNRSPGANYDGGAFDIDGGVTNSVIQYNRSYGNDGAGLLLAEYQPTNGMSHNVFRYNLSVNDGRDNYGGITISGAASNSIAKSAVFHNNTIVVDKSVNPNTKGAVWFIAGTHDDLVFANNTFVALNGAKLIAGDTNTSLATFTGNSYWTGGAPTILEDTTYASVQAWSVASGQERIGNTFAGITANPQFVDLVDYRPLASSPLVDAGRSPGQTPFPAWLVNLGGHDFGGVMLYQGAKPDVGAWERLPGDFNYNSLLDSGDLSVWGTAYGASGAAGRMADLDGDGDTDGDDFLLWQRSGGAVSFVAASAPVPEPAGASALAAALAALLAIRRRRSS